VGYSEAKTWNLAIEWYNEQDTMIALETLDVTRDGYTSPETESIEALTEYLVTAQNHDYGTATNWLELNQLTVTENNVTADFSKAGVTAGIKGIYDKLVTDNRIDENGDVTGADNVKKDAEAYAIDSYVMNTFARYLGAFGHEINSPVKKVEFNNGVYTWKEKPTGGYLAGSNWKDSAGNTLVSAVVVEQNTEIRTVSFKIVDIDENSIDVTFQAICVPTIEEMQSILQG
jgi:hypothetical protein